MSKSRSEDKRYYCCCQQAGVRKYLHGGFLRHSRPKRYPYELFTIRLPADHTLIVSIFRSEVRQPHVGAAALPMYDRVCEAVLESLIDTIGFNRVQSFRTAQSWAVANTIVRRKGFVVKFRRTRLSRASPPEPATYLSATHESNLATYYRVLWILK